MKTVPFLSFFATLRGRLLLLVCLATLPAILFTFYVAHNERERTLQHSEAEGKYILNIVSQQHIAQISSAKALLRWLANKIESEGTAVPLEDKTYLAAVLSGSVFGDHSSPISDTTVVASLASGSDHIEHVRTQLPYALICAVLATVGFFLLSWLAL